MKDYSGFARDFWNCYNVEIETNINTPGSEKCVRNYNNWRKIKNK